MSDPIRVAIANDYEVVVRGLYDMLREHPAIFVVELDSMVDPAQHVDITLYDAFAAEVKPGPEMHRLLALKEAGRLVVWSWRLAGELIDAARQVGVSGYLSKAMTADELADALVRIHAGDTIYAEPDGDEPEPTAGDWPGRPQGLSVREAEVLAFIVQGLSNEEITKRLYLSINSVKSYIRSAYRKMGVSSRSRAILWGLEHGFRPEPKRTILNRPASNQR